MTEAALALVAESAEKMQDESLLIRNTAPADEFLQQYHWYILHSQYILLSCYIYVTIMCIERYTSI